MRHACPEDLGRVEPLLARVRHVGAALTEKKRGLFYLKSKSFLHFHEDPKGMFADIRTLDWTDFDRFCVDEEAATDAVVERVRVLAGG